MLKNFAIDLIKFPFRIIPFTISYILYINCTDGILELKKK